MYCRASATDWIRSSCLIEAGLIEIGVLLETGLLVTGCRWVAIGAGYCRAGLDPPPLRQTGSPQGSTRRSRHKAPAEPRAEPAGRDPPYACHNAPPSPVLVA